MSEVTTALAVLSNITPIIVFTEGGADPLLEAIKKEVSSFVPDISTVKGRKEIASLANKVAKSKVYLDDLGKDLVSEWKEKSKKVDAERKKIRDTLDLLKEEVRLPLTQFEEKEEFRIREHEDKCDYITSFLSVDTTQGSLGLKADLARLEAIVINESYEEFQDRAIRSKETSLKFLHEAIAKRLQFEKDQAELEKLRQEKAIQEQKEREDRIAKEAAEKARQESELKAKAEQDKIEQEKAEAVRKQKEAEEAVKRAEAKAAQDKIDAENKAKEAAKKAEEAQKAAVEAERLRAQKEKEREEAETLAREKNLKHKKLINNEALTGLVNCAGIDEVTAKRVIEAIVKGQIPNVKISY